MCIYNINLDLAICYASKIPVIPWNYDIFTILTTTQLAHSKDPHWFLLLITHVIQMFEQPANTSLIDD